MYTCLDNAYCDGWVMSAILRMVASLNTSSTVSWHWGGEPPAAMQAVDIDNMTWEGLVADRTEWGSASKQHLKIEKDKLLIAAANK